MTVGEAAMVLHHLLDERQVRDSIDAVMQDEARKSLDEMRRSVKANDAVLAAVFEAKAQAFEQVLGVLKATAAKYQPAG